MKKHLLIVLALVALVGFKPNANAQTGNNVLIEYITGTWCGYCPCGHVAIDNILANYPNTMVLAYHGASSDPWQSWTAGIRLALFGPSQSYPTGIVGRRTGVLSRNAWNNPVVIQSLNIQPGVTIAMNNKQYNSGTRTISGSVVMTANETLTGDYYVMFVLTENNIVYPQNYYAECGTPGYHNDYVHDHVVKAMINGDQGTLVNTGSTWSTGAQFTVPVSYVLPGTVVAENSVLNVFVYKNDTPLNQGAYVQQTRMESITQPTGIISTGTIPETYSLTQNYPNPFNPTTNINFSIPKDQNASLKFYNSMGQEVATYVDGFLKAGVYNVDFDGSSFSSGIYFYTLSTADFVETKKMMLVK